MDPGTGPEIAESDSIEFNSLIKLISIMVSGISGATVLTNL